MRSPINIIRLLWLLYVAATLWFALIPADKGGLGGAGYHGVAFFVLGVLTPAAFPAIRAVFIWLVLLALGGGIELAQTVMGQGRYGEWSDFLSDAVAATAGVLCYRIWMYLSTVNAPKESCADKENDPSALDLDL